MATRLESTVEQLRALKTLLVVENLKPALSAWEYEFIEQQNIRLEEQIAEGYDEELIKFSIKQAESVDEIYMKHEDNI